MLSYSGLTNYGKPSLPSVKGWNGSLNILRDPPKGIYTTRAERVGDTNDIMNTLAHSGDRFIEAINYYPRGVNPMVSVTYGEGQTVAQTSSRGQAYLPYRIMKDGAFRPPIKRQEDLLPLSRLPRKWTSVECNRTDVADHTKRLIAIGTAANTHQVKNELRKIECETKKIFNASPAITAPLVTSQTRDDVLSAQLKTFAYDPSTEIVTERPSFERMRDIMWVFGTTNEYNPSHEQVGERPQVVLGDILVPSANTNPTGTNTKSIVPQVPITLSNKLPAAVGYTNSVYSGTGEINRASFMRLPTKTPLGGYEGRPNMPQEASRRVLPTLGEIPIYKRT